MGTGRGKNRGRSRLRSFHRRTFSPRHENFALAQGQGPEAMHIRPSRRARRKIPRPAVILLWRRRLVAEWKTQRGAASTLFRVQLETDLHVVMFAVAKSVRERFNLGDAFCGRGNRLIELGVA